ncbi:MULTISPECIES: cytochrome c oxidase subunit 3 [unclassified Rhizobium]|uniref:cytochrome c oxidase subunit 3 n=1 Tax=unclassified Rhizobium TaxID=2613769 RepID=UPI000715E6DF|nr:MULTISPECIES: cytochrome c oxidase subunit 3 [unclassified Rhizobium]KQS82379.1 NorE accessory protein for nitric oxide reductase [Rhizobium sp. Leaf386]KQT02726.1 NorE accessory protein for nitric oxide reductase [Rhizobium sp. Leaf391]KQU03445.1 NorE accessory protein for nitric oxide reductase [Rhizobium sp. Leaf453]
MAVIGETVKDEPDGGDLILWLLVWSELAAFGVLLCGFLLMSYLHQDSFSLAKIHLDGRLASINTLVLIASGWLAAEAARASVMRTRQLALVGAAVLGFLFAAIKLLEYREELRFAGDATFNAFFELYFMITGFHLAHVVFLGLIMLLVARKPDRSNVVIVTTIWHIVDVVWLVIFPVVYLG